MTASTGIAASHIQGATLHSFDLFTNRWSLGCVRLLQKQFPGRLFVHRGDSLSTISRDVAVLREQPCVQQPAARQ